MRAAPAIETPDRRAVHDRRAAGPGLGRERLARPVVVAQDGSVGDRRRGDAAIDLAADAGILVEQHGREAGARRQRGRRETGGPAADHDEVV